MKAKPRNAPELQKKKQKRNYTEKELDLPTLNAITPVGVQKPRGKKKGKVFVDDKVRLSYDSNLLLALFDWALRLTPSSLHAVQESMTTILAMVNAEKEGQIESKMMKARHMEEIRDAKRKEAEVREQEKKSKLVSGRAPDQTSCCFFSLYFIVMGLLTDRPE